MGEINVELAAVPERERNEALERFYSIRLFWKMVAEEVQAQPKLKSYYND